MQVGACWRLGFVNEFVGVLAGLVGGAQVLLEKKQRRIELALYVTSHALKSAWRYLKNCGFINSFKHGEVGFNYVL